MQAELDIYSSGKNGKKTPLFHLYFGTLGTMVKSVEFARGCGRFGYSRVMTQCAGRLRRSSVSHVSARVGSGRVRRSFKMSRVGSGLDYTTRSDPRFYDQTSEKPDLK